MTEALQSFDVALLRWLTPWHSVWLDRMMVAISASGGAGAIWLGLGLIAFIMAKYRAAAWRVF